MTKETLVGAPPSEEDMHGLPDALRAYLTFLQPKLAAIRDEYVQATGDLETVEKIGMALIDPSYTLPPTKVWVEYAAPANPGEAPAGFITYAVDRPMSCHCVLWDAFFRCIKMMCP
jgi:hypothetical protein